MTTREKLTEALRLYSTPFAEEAAFVPQMLALLEHPRAFHRDHLPGHMTGSAWIVDETRNFVLLTFHAKLNRWLQPGGHADGNENILEVALREAAEETGLTNLELIHPKAIFDIDIHRIPARKEFPEHFHYDVRFLLRASRADQVIVTPESHDLRWIEVANLADQTVNNTSMLRMAFKVRDRKL